MCIRDSCKEAIEQTINDYYGNNRLAAESAVKSILEKFSPERVAYVLANTIQQKDHDGRISRDCKAWAKGMDCLLYTSPVCLPDARKTALSLIPS